jgi:hypothetical protein
MINPDDELRRGFARQSEASEELFRLTTELLDHAGRMPRAPKDELPFESPESIAFRIAMTAVEYGLVCPGWASQAVTKAWKRFEGFEVKSINEAFGIPPHLNCKKKRDDLKAAIVYAAVRDLQKDHVPQKENSRGDGAFARVGKKSGMSASKVRDLRNRWIKLCEVSGSDPDEPLRTADPSIIYAAIAEALRPTRRDKIK